MQFSWRKLLCTDAKNVPLFDPDGYYPDGLGFSAYLVEDPEAVAWAEPQLPLGAERGRDLERLSVTADLERLGQEPEPYLLPDKSVIFPFDDFEMADGLGRED